jgi:hypothetical protein
MRLLLSDATNLLFEYVEYGMCATDQRVVTGINLAIERLLPMLNPEKTIGRYTFSVNSNQITLPRDAKTILSGVIDYSNSPQGTTGPCLPGCAGVVQVRSRWYEMVPGGPAHRMVASAGTLVDMGTGYFTFADITPDYPCYVRVYAALQESSPPPGILPGGPSPGEIWISGLDVNNNEIYTIENGQYTAAAVIPIPIVGQQNYVDSPMAFNQITSVSKPLTNGPLSLYAVSLDKTVQTPIAVYQAEETRIDYRRYHLSWYGTSTPATITVLCKRQFNWTSDPTSDLMITNVGALQNALMAMKYEKAGSFQQAQACWTTAVKILDTETRDYDGEYDATPQLQQCFAAGDIWNLR